MHPEQASIQFNTHIGPKYSIEESWKFPWEWETQKVSEFPWQVILKFIISFHFIKNQHGAPDNVHAMIVCRTSVTCESCK